MAFVSDNRPHTLGDLIVITGTIANGDTSADLSDYLSEVLMVTVVANSGAAAPAGCAIDTTTTTTVRFSDPGANGGRIMVFGKR